MNDELSPRERADMRDVVLAGAQRIRPEGRHRTQLIAAAIALVLVGGVTGGAVTTAALIGAEQRPVPAETATPTETTSPTPTPTLTPTPTPTAEEPPAPVQGVMPFGGECANTITDEEADALRGVGMMRSDYRWETGANTVLGGIDCVWVSEESYLNATLHLYAYPESVVPESVRTASNDGCVPQEGPDSRVECSATDVVDGMWLHIRAAGLADQVTQQGVDALLASASARLGDHPPGTPATPTSEWWAALDCAQIAAAIDPAIYGYERVALLESQSTSVDAPDRPEGISFLAGAAYSCDLHFTSGSGDSSSGEVVTVTIVPGGAVTFQTAVDAEHSQSVDVAGAQAAVTVPGLDRYEGSNAMIVATDGVNMLMVVPDMTRDTADAAGLAGALFALMHP